MNVDQYKWHSVNTRFGNRQSLHSLSLNCLYRSIWWSITHRLCDGQLGSLCVGGYCSARTKILRTLTQFCSSLLNFFNPSYPSLNNSTFCSCFTIHFERRLLSFKQFLFCYLKQIFMSPVFSLTFRDKEPYPCSAVNAQHCHFRINCVAAVCPIK
jgi:hypothetical protein